MRDLSQRYDPYNKRELNR